MHRRQFNKLMGAAVAGMTIGSHALAQENATEDKPDKHICRGRNECKGLGNCKSDKHECAGKNDCKGQGGCASLEAKHDCAGQNECKGLGGCAGKVGKNDCKGQGGCAVPIKPEHQKTE